MDNDNPTETPIVWTLTCCTADGGASSHIFDTYLEALASVPLYLERPDCLLVSIGYSTDWQDVTLFMFTRRYKMTNPFKSLERLADDHPNPEVRQAIGLALDTIQHLEDENNSLWDMLEELRASDMAAHQQLLVEQLARLLPVSGEVPES